MYRTCKDLKKKGTKSRRRCSFYKCDVAQANRGHIRKYYNRIATIECEMCGFKRVFGRIPKKQNRER